VLVWIQMRHPVSAARFVGRAWTGANVDTTWGDRSAPLYCHACMSMDGRAVADLRGFCCLAPMASADFES
jgi:hypothetical protein